MKIIFLALLFLVNNIYSLEVDQQVAQKHKKQKIVKIHFIKQCEEYDEFYLYDKEKIDAGNTHFNYINGLSYYQKLNSDLYINGPEVRAYYIWWYLKRNVKLSEEEVKKLSGVGYELKTIKCDMRDFTEAA